MSINQLKMNNFVSDYFGIKNKNIKKTKEGKDYLELILFDNTGNIRAVWWDNFISEGYSEGDIVKITGNCSSYNDNLQITINSLEIIDEKDINNQILTQIIPYSSKNIDDMWERFQNEINSIKNSFLKSLLTTIFSDENISSKFKKLPAAKDVHHNYIGGLLEHTLNVATLIKNIPFYENFDKDLALAGALIHDIGKIEELMINKTTVDYTNIGKLCGHIVLGIEIVDRYLKKILLIDEELLMKLKHIIISHHGMMEFGSPKVPMFAEAYAVHYCDILDAHITIATTLKNKSENSKDWSDYNRFAERYFYLR